MRNINSIISLHNKNILNPKQKNFGYNCSVQSECPLNGKCLTPRIIYRADVTNLTNNDQTF